MVVFFVRRIIDLCIAHLWAKPDDEKCVWKFDFVQLIVRYNVDNHCISMSVAETRPPKYVVTLTSILFNHELHHDVL